MPWLAPREEAGGKYTLYWRERTGTDPQTGKALYTVRSEATGCVRLSDAKRYLAKWQRDREAGIAPKPSRAQVTAENPAWGEYWATLTEKFETNYRAKSWAAKRDAWKQATKAFNPSRLSDITHDDVIALRANWALSPVSFNDFLRNMSWIYEIGRKRMFRDKGTIEPYRLHGVANPFANVRRLETFKKSLEVIPFAKVEELIQAGVEYSKGSYVFGKVEYPNPNVWTMFVLIGYCGLRSGEAENARWEWIDWGKRLFTVTQTADFQTKGKKNRTMPLFDSWARWLEPIRQDSGYIYQPETTAITPGYGRTIEYRRAFRQVCKMTGCVDREGKPTIYPHLFRHSWITNMLHLGVDDHELADWSGHSSLWIQQEYVEAIPPKPGRTSIL